jgi:hypothetical protein
MDRKRVLRMVLVAALSGSLFVGCSSDGATTSTTPPENPLVGTWLTDGPNDEPVVVLELTADGDWTYRWGQSRDTVSLAGSGTYEVDGDTVTWLGGECEVDAEGVYTYTLENGQFTQTLEDDPCVPRRMAYADVTFTAETE